MALSNDDLKIVVGAQLTTKEAQETLKNFVKTSSQTKVVINTEVDSNGIERAVKIYKTINKYLDEHGNLLETATHQRQLSNGALSAENGIISKVVEGYKKLNNSKQDSFKNSELASKSTIKVTDAYGRLVTIIEKYNKEGNKLKQVIVEEKTAYGQIKKTVDEYLGSEEKLINHYTEEYKDLDQLANAQKKYNNELKKTVGLKEKHTYRTFNKDENRYENVTIETITDEHENKIKTITREYETLAGTVKVVSQQTKDLGKTWSEEEKISEEVISNEIKSVRTLYEEITKYKNAQGQTVTRTNSKDSEGNRYSKIEKEYQDELGRTIQEVTEYIQLRGQAWKKNGETTKKIINDEILQQEKLAESQKKATAELQKRITAVNTYKGKEKEVYDLRDKTIHKLQSEVKETTNANNEMTRVTTTTDKFIDSQGMLNTKVIEATEKFEIVDGQLKKVGDTLEKTTVNVEKTKHGLNQLGQSFTDVIVKVAKFYLASLPIRAVQSAITNAIQSVKDFDGALTEFKKVSDLSGESLNKYTEKLEKLGKLTARTRTEMVEMATEFKRSSYSDEESAQLAKTASLYQNIADEELSASDAASVLISQMKAFQKQGIEAEHVIDSINEVANRNAVSSGDIGRGLTQAGAALATYGNTFEETIGLVTAGTEIFQGRSQQVKSRCLLNIA